MEVTEFRRSYWAENWHRTIELWEKRSTVVGVALLAVASLGYGAFADDPTMAKIGAAVAVAYLVINFLILTPWAMWKDAQEKIVEFDDLSLALGHRSHLTKDAIGLELETTVVS